eukprot:CAMPEP_0113654094 /NCGR_PEP_ID=MMETSP0017_2-20120614/28967_1 /TAXON_ID=2856 /ORGANISM="Cylindrotheca closterium" /LENGTH=30 /DNA_ID=CAMNT_0000567207 /DNA_START=162 /DNA_END=251 /DNA_ORIENTATION=+ /assembly_acc=CAM_ASM_000147
MTQSKVEMETDKDFVFPIDLVELSKQHVGF